MSSDIDPESFIPDPALLLSQARTAITQDGCPNWPMLLHTLAASAPRTPVASQETVDAIRELLLSEKFLALQDSWNLMHFLLQNWSWLPQNHAASLQDPIGNSFDRFAHWMGAFIVGEILGELYCNAKAMSQLETLAQSAGMPARGLVAHGLESLARTTKALELRRSAIDVLGILANDEEPAVRDEALKSLRKVDATLGESES